MQVGRSGQQVEKFFAAFLVQHFPCVSHGGEHQVLFMLKAVQLQQAELHPAALPHQALHHADAGLVAAVMKGEALQRRLQVEARIEHILAQRVGQPIDTGVLRWGLAFADELVPQSVNSL